MNSTRKTLLGDFACHFPNCNARYRRKEHLRRHEAQHIQDQSFPCSICGQEFGRSDTLRRHLRVKHDQNEPAIRVRRACASCRAIKARCEGKPVCTECQHRGICCSLQESKDSPGPDFRQLLSPQSPVSKEEQYVHVYFERFHSHWPFMHKGTFRVRNEIPVLVYSMVMIGMWVSGEENSRSAAVDLHDRLSSTILQLKDKEEGANNISSWPIPLYQAMLLHIIFSLLYKTQGSVGLDSKLSISGSNIELLLKFLIQSCRSRGMFYYPSILAQFREVAIAQYILVSVEEVKRFNIALYRVCTTIYKSVVIHPDVDGCSENNLLLTVDELQFPVPDNHALWDAAKQEEWDCAVREMNVHGLDDTREDDWISRHSTVVRVLGDV